MKYDIEFDACRAESGVCVCLKLCVHSYAGLIYPAKRQHRGKTTGEGVRLNTRHVIHSQRYHKKSVAADHHTDTFTYSHAFHSHTMSEPFNAETAGNFEEIEMQFAVKTVEHLEVGLA